MLDVQRCFNYLSRTILILKVQDYLIVRVFYFALDPRAKKSAKLQDIPMPLSVSKRTWTLGKQVQHLGFCVSKFTRLKLARPRSPAANGLGGKSASVKGSAGII